MRAISSSIFLASRILKNRVLFSVRRLKRPRYLASAVLSIAYFILVFGRNRTFVGIRGGAGAIPGGMPEVMTALAALVIFVVMVVPWAWPSAKAALEFTETEIQFLFPAPLSRRDLMLYKMIRSLPSLLVSAIVFRLVGRGGSTTLGLLVAMFALNNYMMLVRCARARLRMFGIGWLPRLAAVALVLSGVFYLIWRQAHGALLALIGNRGAVPPVEVAKNVAHVIFQLPLGIVFAIPRVVATAATSHLLWTALGACILTLALSVGAFYVASALDINFEDATLEFSRRKSDKQQRRLEGKRGKRVVLRRLPAPFRLGEVGHPAVGIFWKNLIAAGRVHVGQLMLLLFAVVPLLIFAFAGHNGRSTPLILVMGIMALGMSGLMFVLGPSAFRNDLRGDLDKVDLLRSFPLSGASLIAAEVAAPAVLIFILQLALALTGTLLLYAGSHQLSGRLVGLIITAVLLIGPPLNVLQLLIHNGWAVLLPGWSFTSKDDAKGFAATGQGILMMLGHLLVLSVALLPALAVAGVVYLLLRFLSVTDNAMTFALVIPAAILLIEANVAIQWIGAKFEDLDLANDDLSPQG